MRLHVTHIISRARWICLILLLDGVFFSFADPFGGNSFVALVGCVLLGVTIYVFFLLFMNLLAVAIPALVGSRRRLAFFGSLLVVFLLLMQSIGQLGFRDVLAVCLLVSVLYVYVTYLSNRKASDGP